MNTQNILVTGGAGYIGSHTVHMLIQAGYEPVVLDFLENGTAQNIPEGVPFYEGNIADETLIRQIHAEHSFTKVIHFAAYIEAGESMKNPLAFFENNTAKSIQFFTTLEKIGVRNIVFSSTAAVYGNPATVPIPETHPLSPVNYYGVSKLMVEQILESCKSVYGWHVIVLRYFNAAGAGYGIGEQHSPETHLIPIILDVAAGVRKELYVYGTDYATRDGTCLRDYIHVLDLADAHIKALGSLDLGISDTFNVGSGTGHTINELISVCEKVTGKSIQVVTKEPRPGDPAELVADITKITSRLAWHPIHTIEDIVRDAWQWHMNAH